MVLDEGIEQVEAAILRCQNLFDTFLLHLRMREK